jgi:hypothetical protein
MQCQNVDSRKNYITMELDVKKKIIINTERKKKRRVHSINKNVSERLFKNTT